MWDFSLNKGNDYTIMTYKMVTRNRKSRKEPKIHQIILMSEKKGYNIPIFIQSIRRNMCEPGIKNECICSMYQG